MLRALDVEAEVTDFLGRKQPNGNYKCYNRTAHSHDDKSASLSVDLKTGLYKCFGCPEQGDIFDLLLKKSNLTRHQFGILLKRLAAKYGIDTNSVKLTKQHTVKRYEFDGFKFISDTKQHDKLGLARSNIKSNVEVITKLAENYGISEVTITKYNLGWHPKERRLYIPIPAERFTDPLFKTKLINIRKHDILRKHCQYVDEQGNVFNEYEPGTRPIWRKYGKVQGVKGYNVAYLYPMDSVLDNREIWLVGGELKALLLNQCGIPAVCWAAGEGSYHKALISRFTNKIVYVVGDIDAAGEAMVFGTGDKDGIAQVIADNGATEVYAGRLPPDGLPYNGDITDYMRLHGFNPECIKDIAFERIEPRLVFNTVEPQEIIEDTTPEFDEVPMSNFSSLLEPTNAGESVHIPFCVAGRADTPFLLPRAVHATCDAGAMDIRPNVCPTCPMKRHNFEMSVALTQAERIELVGQKPRQVRGFAIERLRLPQCEYPDINIANDSIEKLVIIPTLDKNSKGDQYNYRQHAVYSLGEDYLRENMSYEGVGQVLPDPRNSAYTWAISRQRALDNDIFSYKYNVESHKDLIDRLHNGDTIEDRIVRLVSSIAQHKLQKYGVDRMVLLQLLSFFMPFEFSLGSLRNYKVCSEVCILGETRSGKSSTAKDLLNLFGAGRYVDAPTVTTIGLIGGNQNFGKTSIFTWGVLPMCHRAICVIDEANKLNERAFETITNLRSSGVAERTTVTGIMKTKANVRFLWLCNPRGGKSLRYYKNPIHAAADVFGSPQDLARLDILHVQYAHRDARVVNQFYNSTIENFYTPEAARYHLQWAWSLTDDAIVFENPLHIMDKAVELVETLSTDLLPVAETKFKLARIAAGLSALAYNEGRGNKCYVTPEAVELAFKILNDYRNIGASVKKKEVKMPDQMRQLLATVPPDKRSFLKMFVKESMATSHDLASAFGERWSLGFIQVCYYDLEIIQRKGKYYVWDDYLTNIVQEYLGYGRKDSEKPDYGIA